jgi:acyl-CoA thioester hydrolase
MQKFPEDASFVESTLKVRYKDTDQMGIAHHSNYLVWFEIGRTDLCREAGLSYREIESEGYILVVAEVSCRYRKPYRYDDLIRMRTRIEEGTSRSIRFGYELRDESGGSLHATGQTMHFWVDRETRRPTVVRDAILDRFRPFFPA